VLHFGSILPILPEVTSIEPELFLYSERGELGRDPITGSEGKRLLSFENVRFRYRLPGSINVPCIYEHFGALVDAIRRVTSYMETEWATARIGPP
jgi:hypothetical protein